MGHHAHAWPRSSLQVQAVREHPRPQRRIMARHIPSGGVSEANSPQMRLGRSSRLWFSHTCEKRVARCTSGGAFCTIDGSFPIRGTLIGQHARRNGLKMLRAFAQLEAVRAPASGEQSSCSDVKKWASDYFGQRTSQCMMTERPKVLPKSILINSPLC